MNTIDTVFEWLLAATLRASVLVVAVLFIQMIVRRWLSAGWRHALWLPMLAVLVLPVLPKASFGLFPKAAEQPTTASEVFVSSSGSTETSISAMPAPEVEAEMKTASPINVAAPVNYFAIAWLVGACGVLAAGIIGYRQNMLRIRTNAITPDRMLQASIDEAAREVGLKRAPQTLISSSVASPAVTGFIRPILLLPAGFPEGFSASEVRLILLHEFTHLKRLDLQLNWLVCVLQAAHWFNPLLWFAFARMRADREAACDASVLSIDAKDYRAEYVSALLKLECVAPSRMLSLGFVGIFERGSEIKSRIKEISAHRANRFLWQAVGGSIVTLLMVFGITKGQEAKPQEVAVARAELKVDEATVEIQNKLNSIIIPRIDFEDRTLQESIDYLRLRAAALDEKELDPKKKGFNFVILNPNEGAAAIKIDELRLRNVPLSTALKLICDKTHYRYTVENFSVVLAPNDQPSFAVELSDKNFKKFVVSKGVSELRVWQYVTDDNLEKMFGKASNVESFNYEGRPYAGDVEKTYTYEKSKVTTRSSSEKKGKFYLYKIETSSPDYSIGKTIKVGTPETELKKVFPDIKVAPNENKDSNEKIYRNYYTENITEFDWIEFRVNDGKIKGWSIQMLID